MTVFKSLLDSDDDWMERFRRVWYPRLHGLLSTVGLYSVGTVSNAQYAGTVELGEEDLEVVLVDLGFERNPIACYKYNGDRSSEGSWVLRSHDDTYGLLEGPDYQLHTTLFPREDGRLDVYAHVELDWQDRPIAHLKEVDFQEEAGATAMHQLLTEETELELGQELDADDA